MSQATQAMESEGRLGKFLLLALAALICGVAADVVLVLPYALSSEPWRMWFAAFGIGALFSALAAGWVGTLIASNRSRSRLLMVVGTSEAAAAILAAGGFLLLRSAVLGSSALLPVLSALLLGLGIAIIALVGSWAALRFRSSRRRLAPDILATVGLLALMVVVHVKTIIFAPLS
jgi:hypothetical protein